jgi:hypothetical protein
MTAAHALRCLHPGCPRTPTAGILCDAHASRRHPPVRATVLPRTATVQAAYDRAWADHDPTRELPPQEALRNRLGRAQEALARAAARHSRAPSQTTTAALDAALSRVYGAVVALREVV